MCENYGRFGRSTDWPPITFIRFCKIEENIEIRKLVKPICNLIILVLKLNS